MRLLRSSGYLPDARSVSKTATPARRRQPGCGGLRQVRSCRTNRGLKRRAVRRAHRHHGSSLSSLADRFGTRTSCTEASIAIAGGQGGQRSWIRAFLPARSSHFRVHLGPGLRCWVGLCLAHCQPLRVLGYRQRQRLLTWRVQRRVATAAMAWARSRSISSSGR